MTRAIDTAGAAARHNMLLRVECLICGHVGHHRAQVVAQAVGYGCPLDNLPFVCSRCRSRKVRTAPQEFHPDRPPKVTVWVPMQLRR